MANYWTLCWKCSVKIKDQKDCNYLKTRNGDFSFCPTCYEEFLQSNTKFLRPEVTRNQELDRSLRVAMEDFHNKTMEFYGGKMVSRGKVPPVVIHKGDRSVECNACGEILKYRESVLDKYYQEPHE